MSTTFLWKWPFFGDMFVFRGKTDCAAKIQFSCPPHACEFGDSSEIQTQIVEGWITACLTQTFASVSDGRPCGCWKELDMSRRSWRFGREPLVFLLVVGKPTTWKAGRKVPCVFRPFGRLVLGVFQLMEINSNWSSR